MRHGPYVFLGLLFALALSWLGMIVTPQFQLGSSQPTNLPPTGVLYPTPVSGLASLGREVYRANGCAYCHTRVVRQEGSQFEVVLTDPGTNQAAVVEALRSIRTDLSPAEVANLVATAPKSILVRPNKPDTEVVAKTLTDAGAQADSRLIPLGPDIRRGWGTRLTVANDYLYENPLMLGSARLGPDLTNVGLRRPDRAWHLMHLYDPKLVTPGSIMPRYPYLFEVRKPHSRSSPDALPIKGGPEIVPTREANALVAYLLSMRAELPLFEAPGPLPAGAKAGDTNQPGGTLGNTNQAPGSASATNQPAPQ